MAKNQFRTPLYTEAPWIKDGSLDDLFIGRVRKDGSWAHVAHVHTEGDNPPRYEEADANATLIERAPEMYELLLELRKAQAIPNIHLWDKMLAIVQPIERELNAIKEGMPY